ncbi:MAG: hypothetical protein AB9M60_24050 [Leptothrix sp. (in: b-proteobacteria)]
MTNPQQAGDASGAHGIDADTDTNDAPEVIKQPRLWQDNGWTARVIKNEDDEGWAVAMFQHGQSEPALVGPWTMGRDKKNPKPLDTNAFNTLVKTAHEVLRRHEQALHAQLHQSVRVQTEAGRVEVALDIVPDEDDAHAFLSATDPFGDEVARVRVAPNFRLSASSARAWIESGFEKPR